MEYADPETLMAAASHVQRNYVHGCVLSIEIATYEGAKLEVLAPDGARFALVVDRYGNVARCYEHELYWEALERLRKETEEAIRQHLESIDKG